MGRGVGGLQRHLKPQGERGGGGGRGKKFFFLPVMREGGTCIQEHT